MTSDALPAPRAEQPTPGPAPVPQAASSAEPAVGLPRRERDVLAFERQWWRHAGAKEAAIKEQFGLSATRYYQVLNTVIDRPEALAVDPLLVRRLRRMRATRQRQRSARTLGIDV